MKVTENIATLREYRKSFPGASWGLVPTMGYLHEGHLSLIRRAKAENDKVGVSIFVNPTQFNNPDDLNKYPRDVQRDLDLLSREQVDLVWVPTPEIVYPAGYQTYVTVEELSKPLEGEKRPGHFRGVTTVVAKLFNVFQPDRVYFGQKDAQQAAVIRQMILDLNFDLEMVVCPIVREPDGLAMSSRNVRLSPEARKDALCLYRALQHAEKRIAEGQRHSAALIAEMRQIIEPVSRAKIDYISITDPQHLQPISEITYQALISLAVYIDDVRLIDNTLINIKQENP
jgi:pantoate--beta-alanine ligase